MVSPSLCLHQLSLLSTHSKTEPTAARYTHSQINVLASRITCHQHITIHIQEFFKGDIYIIIESCLSICLLSPLKSATYGGEILYADARRVCAGHGLGLMSIGVIVGKKMKIFIKLCLHFCCGGSKAAATCCYI